MTLQEPLELINIIDDYESRLCKNCEYYNGLECSVIQGWDCYDDMPTEWEPPEDFGCNKFKRIDNENA